MFVEHMLSRARERRAMIGGGASVMEAADLMSKPHTDLVVVCGHGGAMIGVLTKTDIVRQMGQCGSVGCTATVNTIMTCDVVSCELNESLNDIWLMMKERGLQRIPVVDQRKKPIGIIYARDALQNLLGEVKDQEMLLRDYVMNVGYR